MKTLEQQLCLCARLPLHSGRHQRRGGTGNRAALPVKPNVGNDIAIEPHIDVHMITAQRILSLRRVIRTLEHTVVAWLAIVVEDDLLVQLLKVAHVLTTAGRR